MAVYLLLGAGVALVLEGLLCAAAPGAMKRVAAAARLAEPGQLRLAGLGAVAAGVGVVALARSLGG